MRIPHNVSYEVPVNMRRAHYHADAGGAHTVVMGLRETATRWTVKNSVTTCM